MTDLRSHMAVIFTGGYCNTELLPPEFRNGDFYIAADSGRLTAEKCGVHPHIIAGDFDSSDTPTNCGKAKIVTVPAEKDYTDTMLACELALEQGYSQLLILGGTGGRIDHTFSNVFLLEGLQKRGVTAVITDGENRIRLLKNETFRLCKDRFSYFSLFALEDARVTVEGGKYPLADALLTRDNPYAVSNEFNGNEVVLSVSGGAVLLMESDAH